MTRTKTIAQESGATQVRYEADGLQVELAPDHAVQIPLSPPAEREKLALLRRLLERPRLAAALAEHGAGGIAKLLPAEPTPRPLGDGEAAARAAGARGGMRCACGDPGCAQLAPALAAARAAWAADAELRLRWLGWTREALLAAVWAAWAAEAPLADAEAALRRAAGPREGARREAAGPGGQPLAERLAEAAEQGRLHEPGPEFHDVDVELGPAGPAAAGAPPQPGPDPAPWAALLPGVRGAATGLSLVAERVMQRAEELAAPLRRRPR